MLDVGCGDGSFVRALLDQGADAVGLEVEPETLARARASGLEEARLVLGDGRSLPFPDQSFDAVCCVFSFHHIPAASRPAMIDEIARVLRPGGGFFVFEPQPQGHLSSVMRRIEDETRVRTDSQAYLASAPGRFDLLETVEYELVRPYADVAAFIRGSVAVDPERAEKARDPEVVADVEAQFDRFAEPLDDGRFILTQPCLFYRFRLA